MSVFSNPILVKCARARLRLRHVLSWGTVTFTLTGFVCLSIYLTSTERHLTDAATAARTLILPLVVIQGLILMLLGTGAVAAGIARERTGGLLDYHRMTPMRPTAKILGFMFGLPAREYFLFALTLPFLAFAVIVGQFPVRTLLHFYVVFFSSTWLYHMTGMVSGMVTKKPRRAWVSAQALVLLIYGVLPQLRFVGLSFFEYLTIRPAFMRILSEQISISNPEMGAGVSMRFDSLIRPVPFFETDLHPSVYTLAVQCFLLATMFVVVYRKWIGEQFHSLSKLQGLFVFTGTLMFFMGSLWPILSRQQVLEDITSRAGIGSRGFPFPILYPLLMVMLLAAGALAMFVIQVTTPSRFTMLKGLRRSQKLGLPRIPPGSDAASSGSVTVLMLALSALAFGGLVALDMSGGRFMLELPGPRALLTPMALLAAMLFFVHGLRERYGSRAYYLSLFLFWLLPIMTCGLLFAAREAWVLGTYIALPFPPMSLWLAVAEFLKESTVAEVDRLVPDTLLPHLTTMNMVSTGGYAALAVVVQLELRRWRKGLQPSAKVGP